MFSSIKPSLLTSIRMLRKAHPTDEWHVYSDVDFRQPTSLPERAAAAKKFLRQHVVGAEATHTNNHPPLHSPMRLVTFLTLNLTLNLNRDLNLALA